ncbi:MAG: hypothetical protein HZA58_06355, partial [Acidimicrobiia bacterium]|nr:hypothetical protein [Acidimicrobiia bacterium]
AAPLVRRRRAWVVVVAAGGATLAATAIRPTAWRLTGAAGAAAQSGAFFHE